MQQKFQKLIPFLLSFLIVAGLLTACGDTTSYDNLQENVTVDYLYDEYTTQLLNDGAEHLVGSIEIGASENGSREIILHPKEISQDPDANGNYEITSYVLNRVLYVPDQLYATFFSGDETSTEKVLTAEEFIKKVTADYKASNATFDDYGDHKLYDVYALDDQVLLILATYIPQ